MLGNLLNRLPWFQYVEPREPPTAIGRTAGLVSNPRAPIALSRHRAPEPPRQGDVPSRASTFPLARWKHDQTVTQEDRFVAIIVGPAPRATYPRGRQAPQFPRSNIRVPSHVAYGSLFTSDEPTYGLG